MKAGHNDFAVRRLWTVREASLYLAVLRFDVVRLVWQRRIPFVKVGRLCASIPLNLSGSSRQIAFNADLRADSGVSGRVATIRARLAKGRKQSRRWVSTKEGKSTGLIFTIKTESGSRSLRKVPIGAMPKHLLTLRKSDILRGCLQAARQDHVRRIRRALYGTCEGKQAVLVAGRTNA